jgi:hypothetical protein
MKNAAATLSFNERFYSGKKSDLHFELINTSNCVQLFKVTSTDGLSYSTGRR